MATHKWSIWTFYFCSRVWNDSNLLDSWICSPRNKDSALQILDKFYLCKSGLLAFPSTEAGWLYKLFYVSKRFYIENSELSNIIAFRKTLENLGSRHTFERLYFDASVDCIYLTKIFSEKKVSRQVRISKHKYVKRG